MSGLARDPFASTADPEAYVPRPAADAALAHLTRGLDGGRRIQVLTGPPGIGKTMLMRVLAHRLGSRYRTLYLPYASMPLPELCHWMLGLWGEAPDAYPDATAAFLASARRHAAAGTPTLLLVDDASTMPLDTARALAALVAEAAGSIRLLLVPAEDQRTAALLGALAPDAPELRLSAPFGRDEARRFLHSRLARADAPAEVQDRFTPEVVGLLHRLSGGVPRLLNHLADEVVRGKVQALPRGAAERDAAQPARDDGVPPPEPEPAPPAAPAPGPAAASAPEPAPGPAAASAPEPEPPSAAPAPRFASPADPDALHAPAPPPVVISSSEAAPKRMGLVIAINLALAAGTLALLWLTGLFPPPGR